MDELQSLIDSIEYCPNGCGLLKENKDKKIPFVKIKPKPYASVVFFGRDPNPNSVKIVGEIDKKSSFNRGILKVIDGINENKVYITNMLKCHWRVKSSNNNPYPQINYRKANIPNEMCKKCISRWLVKEIGIIKPKAIVTFGEEVYQQFKQFIVEPNPSCIPKLSASKDKSIMDAEKWQYVNNCSLKIMISGMEIIYYAIRHPGNYGLRKDDIRRIINNANISRINEFLKEGKVSEDILL